MFNQTVGAIAYLIGKAFNSGGLDHHLVEFFSSNDAGKQMDNPARLQ
jgi:hypothetical protein